MTDLQEKPTQDRIALDELEHRHMSVKGATIATARALLENPETPTEHLEGVSTFKPERDAAGSEEFVRNKAERYAIAGAAIDIITNDIVTNPSDAREARFVALPNTEDDAVAGSLLTMGCVQIIQPQTPRTTLKNDISGAVFREVYGFLDKHPEFTRAAKRFADISYSPEPEIPAVNTSDVQVQAEPEKPFDTGINTIEGTLRSASANINDFVISEYIPFVQRLLFLSTDQSLVSPEARREAVKDASQILFSLAATNLGHFLQISDSDSPWSDLDIGTSLQGRFIKRENGQWTIQLAPGHERPAKQKTDLAGDTINCPALFKLEENDTASPLHRLVYASINEAYERGMFADRAIEETYLGFLIKKFAEEEQTKNSRRSELEFLSHPGKTYNLFTDHLGPDEQYLPPVAPRHD